MAHAWNACWVHALGGSNPPSSALSPASSFRGRGFLCLDALTGFYRGVVPCVVGVAFRTGGAAF